MFVFHISLFPSPVNHLLIWNSYSDFYHHELVLWRDIKDTLKYQRQEDKLVSFGVAKREMRISTKCQLKKLKEIKNKSGETGWNSNHGV